MRHTLFFRRTTLSQSPRSALSPRLRPKRNQSSSSTSSESVPEKNTASPLNQSHSPSSPVPSAPSEPGSSSFNKSTPPTPCTPPPSSVPVRSGSRSLREIVQAGPVGRLGRSYSRMQDKRPYTTQVVSSIVVYLCGDLSAQLLFPPDKSSQEASKSDQDDDMVSSSEKSGYDPWRTLRHLTVGIGSSIPSYNWFMFLHNNFNFASKFLSILTKVTVQQIVFTPVFNTYFFSVHSLLSGASLEETFERLKVALPVSITNSAKLWPAVTAFSFMYVPPQFRSVFSGVIAVGWQTYLSWLNQKAAREVEAELAVGSDSSQVGVPASAIALKA